MRRRKKKMSIHYVSYRCHKKKKKEDWACHLKAHILPTMTEPPGIRESIWSRSSKTRRKQQQHIPRRLPLCLNRDLNSALQGFLNTSRYKFHLTEPTLKGFTRNLRLMSVKLHLKQPFTKFLVIALFIFFNLQIYLKKDIMENNSSSWARENYIFILQEKLHKTLAICHTNALYKNKL
uniref:Uncharacterized protein n=1 Tax=Oryza glumipatula TaxID=40148 RepID=A0A0D9ZTA3_9ORYZ